MKRLQRENILRCFLLSILKSWAIIIVCLERKHSFSKLIDAVDTCRVIITGQRYWESQYKSLPPTNKLFLRFSYKIFARDPLSKFPACEIFLFTSQLPFAHTSRNSRLIDWISNFSFKNQHLVFLPSLHWIFSFSFENQFWSMIVCVSLANRIPSLASFMRRDQSSCFDSTMFHSTRYLCKFKYHDFLYRSCRVPNKTYLKKSILLHLAKFQWIGVREQCAERIFALVALASVLTTFWKY